MKCSSPVDHLAAAAQLFEAGADDLSGIASSPRGWRFGHPCSSHPCYYPEVYVGE